MKGGVYRHKAGYCKGPMRRQPGKRSQGGSRKALPVAERRSRGEAQAGSCRGPMRRQGAAPGRAAARASTKDTPERRAWRDPQGPPPRGRPEGRSDGVAEEGRVK
jgi:hypothetical protein